MSPRRHRFYPTLYKGEQGTILINVEILKIGNFPCETEKKTVSYTNGHNLEVATVLRMSQRGAKSGGEQRPAGLRRVLQRLEHAVDQVA
jgi:ABC-type hemin transport system ATPase subunit